jgi:hypothetical protein
MTRYATCALRGGVFVAVVLLAASPRSAAGQETTPRSQTPVAFQSHVFRHILFKTGFNALRSFKELRDHAADTVVIFLGDTSAINRRSFGRSLREFVADGGAVLVATDRKPSGETEAELAQTVGVTVEGRTLYAPGAPDGMVYHKSAFCPFLVPEPAAIPDLLRASRVGSGVRLQVATNAPSCLRPLVGSPPGKIRPLALLPPLLHFEGGGRLQPDVVPLFAVGGEIGTGRIILLADHSIFINQMMFPEDNNNVEFTSNCLDYLRGEESNHRGHVLLVEEGEIRTDLEVPLKDVSDLPPGWWRHVPTAVERVLGKLEEQNSLNRGLEDWLTGGGDPRRTRVAIRILVAMVSLLVLMYIAYRVGIRGRYKLDVAVPLLAKAVAKHAPPGPLLEQRRAAALASGNVWETAHGMAREWAANLPVSGNGRPPRLGLRGSWWQRWTLWWRFRRLWKLAHDTEPTPISPRGLRRLLTDLSRLDTARADGYLAFTHPQGRA